MPRTFVAAAVAAGLVAVVCPRIARADLPQIDRGKSFLCLTDGQGREFRVQCAPADAPPEQRICVYAPDSERDTDGTWIKPLERALPCYSNGPFDTALLESQGYKLVEGIAESPYGWTRDDRGRVFQTNFDLHRRLFIGAAWAPVGQVEHAGAAEQSHLGRMGIEFGLLELQHFSGGAGKTRLRHRLSVLEGQVTLAPFGARITALHYDVSVRYRTPLVRITTFFGKPRRHDARLNIGFWFDAGDLEVHQTPQGDNENLWRFATAHATADVWQSADLYSFIRLRTGVGIEKTYAATGPDRDAMTPGAALDFDFTLDTDGRHHLTGEALFEHPIYFDPHPMLGRDAIRMKGELAYELILLAVNDQPISLRVAAGASRRDDIPGIDPTWAYTFTTGLRISLWAPPREP